MFVFDNHEDTFIGFFDLKSCDSLSFEPTYYVEIVKAELVGKTVHLLTEVWCDEQKQGLLCESYDVTSKEFYELVKNFFASEWGHVVSVTTECLTSVSGYAKLMKRNGHLVVDWSILDPEELPCGALCEYYEQK